MSRCPYCNAPLAEYALHCQKCGEAVTPDVDGNSTIPSDLPDPTETVEVVKGSRNPNDDNANSSSDAPEEAFGLQSTIDVTGDSEKKKSKADETVSGSKSTTGENAETADFGTGTVSAPGVEDNANRKDDVAETLELDEVIELDDVDDTSTLYGMEHQPYIPMDDDDRVTLHAVDEKDLDNGNATVDVRDPEATFSEATDQPTHPASMGETTVAATGGDVHSTQSGDDDDDVSTDLHGTQVVGGDDLHSTQISTDGGDLHSTQISGDSGDDAGQDDAGTVVLPGTTDDSGGEKTLIYDSTTASHATQDATGSSGTEGRLKRLWEGVAGSSENPMHSLQAVGLQASDSVFQRVATRRVADAGTLEDTTADYQIIDKLGEGAMGIVFSAKQTAVNRVVAIKTAKPSFQKNDDSRRRFLYEAHITADLDHSNIVPIHELGASEEGMLFYSMKLVQGTEWSRVMRKKSREQNLEIFMKVTDAMAFAHSKGVIHRDLKPENTMLGRFGEVFVTDWGTAINLDRDTTLLASPAAEGDRFISVEDASNFMPGDALVLHDGENTYDRVRVVRFDDANPNRIYLRRKLTRSYNPSSNLRVMKVMNLAGTPCYMAPEMAGHQLPKIAKTSDIYILGAILFDLVTGKAPHTGDSVTQCLRAALENKVVAEDNDDALLTIAYKAMATDPKQRYQTVEELQEAVREYRRHAESIALTERSDELLEVAKEKKDYEAFSRTLFGYQDAIDLWPENSAAVSGLKKARLEFGQVAYSKGDYDLVLQTLNRDIAEEDQLCQQAINAKKKSQSREASIKLLKRVVAAVVLLAVVGLSGLTAYAFRQTFLATQAKTEALSAQKAEEAAKLEAVASAEQEKVAREEADAKRIEADEQRKLADANAEEAEKQRMEAENQKMEAEIQRMKAEMALVEAEEQRREAERQKSVAVTQTNVAKRRAAQIQLAEYDSALALAKSQIESLDVAEGRDGLQRLQELFNSPESQEVFAGVIPAVDNWAWQRVKLLSNADLPVARLDRTVTASAYIATTEMAVVGTADGLIQVLQYGPAGLATLQNIQEPNSTINAVAISPSGDEVVYSYTNEQEVSGLKRWQPGEAAAQQVIATENRKFQHFAYSTDGTRFVAGINGGLWIWRLADNWFEQKTPERRVDSIRGELRNLQGISASQALLSARFGEGAENRLLLAVLNMNSGELRMVDLDESFTKSLQSAAHTLVDNKVAFGLNDNRLLIGRLNPEVGSISELVALEDKHRAPITQIVANGNGQLISVSSAEPVAHVWQLRGEAWQYDTYLTGTRQNIVGVGLVGPGDVLGIDAGGTAIVWDVLRQKQRRQLQRRPETEADSTPAADAKYFAPVQHVATGQSDQNALAIDDNGVVDLWNLADGSTRRIDASRWSYVGHTPGAELVDSAVDLQQGIVVTAASLRKAQRGYLSASDQAWEFCIWDANSGEMRRRWTAANRQLADQRPETIEQRISLLDHGRQILFASDNETIIADLVSGDLNFKRSDFGTYFAVPNPNQPNMVMLVKRSGSVRMLDLLDPTSWDRNELRNFSLADPSDIPLKGLWSDDGRRFYLTFSTGGLAVFRWSGDQLELTWSNRRLVGQATAADLLTALTTSGGRVNSHLDVDLMLTNTPSGEILHIATRNPGLNSTTKLVSVRFGSNGVSLTRNVPPREGIFWLQARADGEPELSERLHDVLLVDSQRIRSRIRLNNQTFVSTNSAQVYGLVDGQQQVTSYGRAPLISSTGGIRSLDADRTLQFLYVLLEDGAIWKFSIAQSSSGDNADGDGSWQRLEYSANGASRISLSHSGNHLLIVSADGAKIVEPDSGASIRELGPVLTASWHPQSETLAICRANGSLEIIKMGQAEPTFQQQFELKGRNVHGIHFFTEKWASGQREKNEHLLVHTEDGDSGYLQFVPIDEPPAGAIPFEALQTPNTILKGSLVVTSPTEGVVVSGAPNGTVTVWFAAPTYDPTLRQLFDLEGHRGAEMTCLTFSRDGQTLVTADANNRLYGWLSSDPLAN